MNENINRKRISRRPRGGRPPMRRGPKNGFSQCSTCQAPIMCNSLISMKDIGIIIHSPSGCSGSILKFQKTYSENLIKQGLPITTAPVVNSNIEDVDHIMGIDKGLISAIDKVIELYNPKVIFIAASCGSGITGFEIQDTIDSVQKKYSVPLIPLVCESFMKKTIGTGFDCYKNPFLKKLVDASDEKEDFYNIINVQNYDMDFTFPEDSFNVIYSTSSVDNLRKAGKAKGTIVLGGSRISNQIAEELEQYYNVPIVDELDAPIGIEKTNALIKSVGLILNDNVTATRILSEYTKKYGIRLKNIREALKGRTCLPIVQGMLEEDILTLLKDIGLTIYNEDTQYRYCSDISDSNGKLYGRGGISLGFFQGYKLINFIQNSNADLLIINHNSLSSWGLKLGIPSVLVENPASFLGYEGLVTLGEYLVDIINKKEYYELLKSRSVLPYKKSWTDTKQLDQINGMEAII